MTDRRSTSTPPIRRTGAHQHDVRARKATLFPLVSDPVLHRRLERMEPGHPAFERRGGAANAYPKSEAFDGLPPSERLLGPVETERCRIDLIMIRPLSRQPLDRPWLTTLFDRTTRIILDAYLSFEPSFLTSLQRALAHAFRKTDRSSLDRFTHD